MEFNEKQEQILSFLDKNYLIKENRFFRIDDNIHEWGRVIAFALSRIFSHDEEFCHMQLKYWSEIHGLLESDWKEAYGPRKLKAEWSPEMANDLRMLHGIDSSEEQVINVLTYELAKEIDTEILKDLKGKLKSDEFLGVVRCIGYETSHTTYDPQTFKPKKGFISMNYNDIVNERNINPHWKDWIRTREQDKKA